MSAFREQFGGVWQLTPRGVDAWLAITEPRSSRDRIVADKEPGWRRWKPTVHVYPDRAEIDGVPYPSAYPLMEALRLSEPGSDPVLAVHGRIPGRGQQIGGGDAGQKAYRADWGDVPMRFAVIGAEPGASIRGFSINSRLSGQQLGGITDCVFANLEIEAVDSGGGKSCVSSPTSCSFGRIRLYDVRLSPDPDAPDSYGGFGMKWGVRSRGRGRYDFRRVTCAPALEHGFYIDAPQGAIYLIGCRTEGSTRTALQIVNRAFDDLELRTAGQVEGARERWLSGESVPLVPGWGWGLVEGCDFALPSGDGGSAITVAGFLGDFQVRSTTIQQIDAAARGHGALVCYTEAAEHHGLHAYRSAEGRLHSMRSLTVEDLLVRAPNADRAHLSASGVERVELGPFRVEGNETALALDSTQPWNAVQQGAIYATSGRVERAAAQETLVNGSVRLLVPRPVSRYDGWQAARKVWIAGQTLSDREIDSRWT